MENRGIALLFLEPRRCTGWVVKATDRPLYPWKRGPVLLAQVAEWAPGSVWAGAVNLPPPPPKGIDPRKVQPVASIYTD
jgi:hypothetical protein